MTETKHRQVAETRRDRSVVTELLFALMLAVAGVAVWWLFTERPPTIEVSLEEVDSDSGMAAHVVPEPGAALVPPVNPDTELDSSMFSVEHVERLVEQGDADGAIRLLQQRLEQLAADEHGNRARLEWLLSRAFTAAGRGDEAEVHLLIARDYLDALRGVDAELESDITAALAALATSESRAESLPGGRGDGSSVVAVSLSRQFRPFDGGMSVGATPSWSPRNHRLEDFPPFALTEPVYQGASQLYGAIALGNGAGNLLSFVFDVPESGDPLVWFDRNGNYDLTDDGPPLENAGSGLFAASIEFPMADILPSYAGGGTFRIWFFTNESLWADGYAAHYCTTVLKGSVSVAGQNYDAYVADSGFNEADFTNDGLFLDLNADGKVSRNELVAPEQMIQIGDARYSFEINW